MSEPVRARGEAPKGTPATEAPGEGSGAGQPGRAPEPGGTAGQPGRAPEPGGAPERPWKSSEPADASGPLRQGPKTAGDSAQVRRAAEVAGASARPRHTYESARLVAVRAWAVVGCVAVFVICVRALAMVGPALESLLVGAIAGFVCSAITNRLERRGVGRALGSLIGLAVVIVVAAGLLLWLVPFFMNQLMQLLGRTPDYLAGLQSTLQDLLASWGGSGMGPGGGSPFQATAQDVLQGFSTVGTRMAGDLAAWLSGGIIPNIMGLANGVVMFFLGLVMAYWFAKDYPVIFRELGIIVGPRHADDLTLLITVLSRSMGGYMGGVVVTSVLNGLLIFGCLTLVHHPYAGLMGILTAILHFIPVVGPMCSAALATLIALFADPLMALWSLVLCVVAQNVTDNLVSPLVMRSAVKIHPAMSLMGITVGASLGGALGMALAIPLTAAIKGVFIYYFESRTGRQLVSYDGAFFKGTPYHHADGAPAPSVDAVDDERLFSQTRLIEADAVEGVEAGERPQPPKRMRITELLHKRDASGPES